MGYLIVKEYRAIGCAWRLLRERNSNWFYLERDGKVIAEGGDRKALLAMGWYE